jgi:hypothetical protein
MKVKTLLFFLLLHSLNAFNQTIIEDVIYLNNGGIYRGKIIDSVQVLTIKIESYDHNVYVINRNEIKTLSKETIDINQRYINSSNKTLKEKLPELNYFKKRIRFNTSINYGVNVNEVFYKINLLSFQIEALYNINKGVGLGIQTGFRTIFNRNRELFLPLLGSTVNYNLYNLSKDDIGNRFEGRMSLPVCLSYDQMLVSGKISTIFHLSLGIDLNLTKPIRNFEESNNANYYWYTKSDFYWKNGIVINPEIRFATKLYKKWVIIPALGFVKNNIHYRFVTEEYSSSPYYTSPVNQNEALGIINYNFLYLKLIIGF